MKLFHLILESGEKTRATGKKEQTIKMSLFAKRDAFSKNNTKNKLRCLSYGNIAEVAS